MCPQINSLHNLPSIQYITDTEGNKVSVVLPIQQFESLMEALENAEDVMLYDAAKSQFEDESFLTLDEYLIERNLRNG